ncbi:MAG: hypothetical protein QNJ55_12950 [Xenococcus sp. MO_188.B8]|nr:hypothetical protein [Xenococcus sp. MO_188.B8]
MFKCPTEIQLTLFIEGKLSKTEAIKIRQHIAECQNCSRVLADIIQLQDLEVNGLLPEVTQQELDNAFRAIEKLRQNQEKALPTVSKTKNHRLTKTNHESNGFLGGVIAAAGLTKIHESQDSSSLTPNYAEQNEKNISPPVRNHEIFSSQSVEDKNSPDTEIDREVETVNNMSTYAKVEAAPTVVGTSGFEGQSSFIQQSHADTCAIRCQELILRDFGLNVPEDVLVNQAMEQGWYTPGGGTNPHEVGNLLELHGVQVNRYERANIFTLTSELAKGNRVIIGVDSGELWNKGFSEELEDQMGIQGADHALIVSGIDTSDPDDVKVILTDPGSGDIAKEYPMEQFIDAWKDSNCFMVATVEPAPLAFNPEMANFNYAQGHLSEIGNLSYGDFQQLFAPCLELELSDSLLKDQAELFSQAVNEDDFALAHPVDEEEQVFIDEHSESTSVAIDRIWDDLDDDLDHESSLNDDDDSQDDNYNIDDEDDFQDDVFS